MCQTPISPTQQFQACPTDAPTPHQSWNEMLVWPAAQVGLDPGELALARDGTLSLEYVALEHSIFLLLKRANADADRTAKVFKEIGKALFRVDTGD